MFTFRVPGYVDARENEVIKGGWQKFFVCLKIGKDENLKMYKIFELIIKKNFLCLARY